VVWFTVGAQEDILQRSCKISSSFSSATPKTLRGTDQNLVPGLRGAQCVARRQKCRARRLKRPPQGAALGLKVVPEGCPPVHPSGSLVTPEGGHDNQHANAH